MPPAKLRPAGSRWSLKAGRHSAHRAVCLVQPGGSTFLQLDARVHVHKAIPHVLAAARRLDKGLPTSASPFTPTPFYTSGNAVMSDVLDSRACCGEPSTSFEVICCFTFSIGDNENSHACPCLLTATVKPQPVSFFDVSRKSPTERRFY